MKGYAATTRSGARQLTFHIYRAPTHQYTIQNSIPNPNRAGSGPKNGIAKVISRIAGPLHSQHANEVNLTCCTYDLNSAYLFHDCPSRNVERVTNDFRIQILFRFSKPVLYLHILLLSPTLKTYLLHTHPLIFASRPCLRQTTTP